MENQTKINAAMISVLLVVASVLGAGLIEQDNVYYGTDGNSITCQPRVCEGLSAINKDGIQTRCYYFSDDLNRSTYKTCSTGWLKYDKAEIKTKEIDGEFFLYKSKNGMISEYIGIDNNLTLYKVSYAGGDN